jgi:hypothetical protein
MDLDPLIDPQTRAAIDAVKRPVLVIAGFATEACDLRHHRDRAETLVFLL